MLTQLFVLNVLFKKKKHVAGYSQRLFLIFSIDLQIENYAFNN